MKHPGADDLVELTSQFVNALDGVLANLEVLQAVPALQLSGMAQTGGAAVDSRYAGGRLAQGALGRRAVHSQRLHPDHRGMPLLGHIR